MARRRNAAVFEFVKAEYRYAGWIVHIAKNGTRCWEYSAFPPLHSPKWYRPFKGADSGGLESAKSAAGYAIDHVKEFRELPEHRGDKYLE